MEEFKELPWKLILEQVPLAHLIKLRRVNRHWRLLVDSMIGEKRELILHFGQSLPCWPLRWYRNDQRINPNNSLLANTDIYANQWFSRQFRDITSLMMVVPSFYHFSAFKDPKWANKGCGGDFNSFINQFENLHHLQIVCFRSDLVYQCRIRSKTLQTLYIDEGDVCLVETPICENLVQFSATVFLNIDRKSSLASKLKYLRCKSLCYEQKWVCFPSLEILVLENQQKPIHLNDFPRLEKLHFNVCENYCGVFLPVFQAKDRNKRPLKIYLSGVQFSFERAYFDDESSYHKAISGLFAELMSLERRTNYTPILPESLKKIWHKLWRDSRFYVGLFPRPTIDVELLRFYVRCKENFESNQIKRTVLYSDSLGQTLEALRSDDANVYESLARCVHKVFFLERIVNKERLLNLKDFFGWISVAYLEEYDQELLDLLPTIFPHLKRLIVNPDHNKKHEPINCNFLSQLTTLFSFQIFAKNCLGPNDLRAILKNCKCLEWTKFEELELDRLLELREWVILCPEVHYFKDENALLNFYEYWLESGRSKHQKVKTDQYPC